MDLRSALERHREHADRRRTERALARALASALSPGEARDLRSLSSR